MSEPTATLSDRLRETLRLLDEAIADAAKRLEDMPDNPRIRRHGGGISFSIPFSELNVAGRGHSWSVFEHDHLAQYKYARGLIENRRFAALRTLLSSQSYYDPSAGVRGFATEVIENITAITGDLRGLEAAVDGTRMGATSSQDPTPLPTRRSPKMRR